MYKTKAWLCGLVACLFLAFGFAATVLSLTNADRDDGATRMQGQATAVNWSRLPLSFTENQGQFGEKTRFRCDAPGATFYLAANGAAYLITRQTDELGEGESGRPAYSPAEFGKPHLRREGLLIRAQFVGANPNPEVVGVDRLSQSNNYFLGNDPSRWKTNVANFSSVVYRDIYPGIDLKYYGDGRSMKYDFVVHPGAHVSTIKIRYEGVEGIQVTPAGDLEIETAFGPLREKAPLIYQEIGGVRRQISGRYEIKEPGTFGFMLDESCDRSHVLLIDPEIVYSTYLGGSHEEYVFDLAVDELGNAYVTGWTNSLDLPTVNAYDATLDGGSDIFVAKLSSCGDSMLYCTYLGGSLGEEGLGIAVDAEGNAYVNGRTWSEDFPTVFPYDDSYNGANDVIALKLSSSGDSLIYSTYLGGSGLDLGWRIAVDTEGYAYLTGVTQSTDFPTENPYDGTLDGDEDAFVVRFSPSGRFLEYSTYLGGTDDDHGYGIAIDKAGCAFVTGFTISEDFPTVNAYDSTINSYGYADAFVTKLTPSGNSLVFSTYLGGSYWDDGSPIAVDSNGSVYVAGRTSSANFPAVNGYDMDHNGQRDSYVAKFSSDGDSLIYSTFLGGQEDDYVLGLDVDLGRRASVIGHTTSPDFPRTGTNLWTHNGSYDVFVARISCSGRWLVHSSLFGGSDEENGWAIALDSDSSAWVTGWTLSSDFPTTPDAFDTSCNGNRDVFITKFLFWDPAAGDANGDDLVDVGDLVYLVSFLFQGEPAPDPLWTGDANCDGEVNVGDLVYLINYLYRGGPPPDC